ncbi:DNA-binding response regulator [Mangrovactinospora gilvigrisea]|uniref:DNA-binding response regulator n=1 Tax=Mangrovactinospora gilvigrisea TaxID=1428644 RepID=A0A1J7BEM3_9ACTN|nr:response regulator transcription factor [Mangrovactinospora gilvigrisea]OIV37143.1 DNA-binding response regulator [Mangrovactinospora gilvigrisea]
MNDAAAPARPIRVLVADDQEMVRTGFSMILDAAEGIEVVGDAADGLACVEEARRLRPDVCLVDIRMPRLDGLEVTRLLAGPEVPDPLRIVVITTFDLDEYVYGALLGGACGFLLKDSGPHMLVESVRAAVRGDALVSPAITVRLLRALAAERAARAAAAAAAPAPRSRQAAVPDLTGRELDVAQLVARGRTNQEIGAELFLSLSTVKTHIANLQGKLGLRNRVETAAWMWQHGLVGGGPEAPAGR